jgi:hypothetical protein
MVEIVGGRPTEDQPDAVASVERRRGRGGSRHGRRDANGRHALDRRPDRDAGRRRLGRSPPSLESGRRSAAGGGCVGRGRRRRLRRAAVRRRARHGGQRPGDRTRRRDARVSRRDDPDPDDPDEGHRGRWCPGSRSDRGRGCGGGARRRRAAARDVLAAGQLAERRHDRLPAWWRDGVARAAARLRLQPSAGDRAGHRRW